MPFTPFHFGPGAALKAVMRSRFSFTIFCYSQVVTDLESGFYLWHGEYPVHRFFHSYVGATLVGLFCALTGRYICQFTLQMVDRSVRVSWSVAFASAFLGTYSHVFLDGIMHRDMLPFSPFSSENPVLHLISLPLLHVLCFALGFVGGLVYGLMMKVEWSRIGRLSRIFMTRYRQRFLGQEATGGSELANESKPATA